MGKMIHGCLKPDSDSYADSSDSFAFSSESDTSAVNSPCKISE